MKKPLLITGSHNSAYKIELLVPCIFEKYFVSIFISTLQFSHSKERGGGFGCKISTSLLRRFYSCALSLTLGHTYRTAIRLYLLGAMLQYTTRRACAASLRHTKHFQWSSLSLGQASHRLRSTVPATASNLSAWANVDPSLAIDRRGTIEDAEVVTNAADDSDTPVLLTTTRLGREVSRIVQSSQDVLHPEVGKSSRLLVSVYSTYFIQMFDTGRRHRMYEHTVRGLGVL